MPSRPPGEQLLSQGELKTYLGSIPEYGRDVNGVQLAGVRDGSPAALAGLRAGDVIIRLATKEIRTIEDLTAALGGHKPGDEVEIVVLRGGTQLNVKATLRARGANLSRG